MERTFGLLLHALPWSRSVVSPVFFLAAFTACAPPPPHASAPKESQCVGYPTLPAQIQEGESLSLAVRDADHDPALRGKSLRYRWLSKYVGEDWTWDAPWNDSPDFSFRPARPGRYDLQVDVAERGNSKPVIQKWLGAIDVQGSLVAGIACSPQATVVPLTTPIDFAIRLRPEFPSTALEFRVWDLLPAERVVTDWQHWPIPPFRAKVARRTAIQIDVRLAAAPTIIDRHWLNDFVFDDQYQPLQANLFRDLVANSFEIMNRAEAVRVTADALWIALHLLLWEHENVAIPDQAVALRRLASVANYEPADKNSGVVTARSGRRYEIDLAARRLHEIGSSLIWRLELNDHSTYRDVFDLLGPGGRGDKVIAGAAYAVYSGFHYGTPTASQYVEDLQESVAHCGERAFLLRSILDHEGVDSEFVEISCAGGGHILVQARSNGSTPLLMDPTTGRIYRFDARRLGKDSLPPPIVLPQVYHIDFLGLRKWYDPSCRATIYRTAKPGIYPLIPAADVPNVSSGVVVAEDDPKARPVAERPNAAE